ncbi:Uncharacterised protein [Mycobacteroides abscessus]|nr:Uncharacterised protein [Mycobacteroides abscessus]CPZ04537.1 Uncharacterised protein [Mycobacteroides abscessus]
MLVDPEIACLRVVKRRHDIPGHAAIRQMVQRREDPRDVVGRVVRRGNRRAQTQSVGRRGHCCNNTGRFQGDRALTAQADAGLKIPTVTVFDRQTVRQKQQIELPAFQGPSDPLVILAAEKAIRSAHVTPRTVGVGHVASREKPSEVQLTALGHGRGQRCPPVRGVGGPIEYLFTSHQQHRVKTSMIPVIPFHRAGVIGCTVCRTQRSTCHRRDFQLLQRIRTAIRNRRQ